MASSSTPSFQKSFKYDVFLSFRGEDTRNNFVGHLYQALKQKGIETYKDDEKIEKGKTIDGQLLESIKESRLYIIVFSKNYASSSWCLDELVMIMECQKATTEHTAYPVFFDVEPTEVRKQSGAVKEAFSEHEKKAAAQKWREAMKEASNLAGWELKAKANGDESKLIQIVADDIFRKLCSTNLSVAGNLVGMDMRIKHIYSSLEIGNDDVRIIGIKGIGGGGKTTLSRAVYDQISNKFEGKSFVENVREASKASLSGLKKLQKQILRDVFNDKKISISGVSDGKNTMMQMMCRKKVLIVLDDVDHSDQLEALVGDLDYFKSGSRIIITTRDEQVLVSHGVSLICNVNLLTDDEALCLFRRYAFGKETSNQGFNEMSGQVVQYAAGLPLTIKVLGSSLRGKSELEWKDALERLKKVPENETQEILKISYDALENDYKEIFLDVSCILKGEQKEKAIRVLESCGFHGRIGLRVLEQKCLINISPSGSLGMHDLIEEMGKNVVRRSHPDSRLWIEEKIKDILDNDLVNETIRCIKLSQSELKFATVMRGLRNMKKLRVLYMCTGANWNDSKVSQHFPNALQYLSWRSYPFWSLHETFLADNLVGLDMSFSSIVEFQKGGERKVLTKLRFLDLSYTALRTLNHWLPPNLEILNLEHCRDLMELDIPDGCPKLKYLNLNYSKLRYINLGWSPDLENISLKKSESVHVHMPIGCLNLRSIDVSHSKLRTLDIELTQNLERLDLENCLYLSEINVHVGCLGKLVYLDLSGCGRFKSFLFDKRSKSLEVGSLSELELTAESIDICPLHPDSSLPKFQFTCSYKEDPATRSFGNLEKLISMGLCACTNVESFSRSICGLHGLKKLTLEGNIPEVPKFLDQLECLEELRLSSTKIIHLPDSVCILKQLKSLKLHDCKQLEKVPEEFGLLESLEELKLFNTKIESLPDSICLLKQLKFLKLQVCPNLWMLPTKFGELESLEELILFITKINQLPDSICMLKELKSLKLHDCGHLEELPKDLGQLESLEELNLLNSKIKRLPNSICMLKHLKSLKLQICQHLEVLPKDFGLLESLEELSLSDTKINHLPGGVCMLKHLKFLQLITCYNLKKLPEDFRKLESLEELMLLSTGIIQFPDSICMLKHLKRLEIRFKFFIDDPKLPEDLGRLQDLEKLVVQNGKFLDCIPSSICELKRLKYFHFLGCTLDYLPEELGNLKCLEELDVTGSSIHRLPQSIFQLKGLRIIGERVLKNNETNLGRLTAEQRTFDNGDDKMFFL